MLEKMLALYKNPKKTSSFAENETNYAEFIQHLFINFDTNCNDEGYFENVFEEISTLSLESAKIFSEMKELSRVLAECFQKTGETVHKIASLYHKNWSFTLKSYQKLKFEADESVIKTNRDLITGLKEWGSELISQKRYVTDNLEGFFHYKKHENIEMGNLLAYKNQITTLYRKKASNLEQTKIKLFESKDMLKWKIDLDNLKDNISVISKGYQLVRPHMLPEVFLKGN